MLADETSNTDKVVITLSDVDKILSTYPNIRKKIEIRCRADNLYIYAEYRDDYNIDNEEYYNRGGEPHGLFFTISNLSACEFMKILDDYIIYLNFGYKQSMYQR
jgi:hypothetical protein